MKKIYVIHENNDWVIPLRAAFNELQLPYKEWFIDKLSLDLSKAPPEGVFYNRMSASAHTRGIVLLQNIQARCWHGSNGMAEK